MRRTAEPRQRPGVMSLLVLGAFHGSDSAAGVLRELRASRPAVGALASAATVSVDDAGSYSVQTTGRPGSGRGFPGMLWEALFGLVFLVHVPGSSYGPGAGALFGVLVEAGVDEGFLGWARSALGPGTSGLGLVLGDGNEAGVLTALLSRGGLVIGTSISAEADARLERELGGPV
jgi:uncharacterized membrane protein